LFFFPKKKPTKEFIKKQKLNDEIEREKTKRTKNKSMDPKKEAHDVGLT
jgi:hypothetical protein